MFKTGKKQLTALLFAMLSLSVLAQYNGGSGTVNDPYQINSLDDLKTLSETPTDWSKHFIQTKNIDASETNSWNGGLGFSPIGDGENSGSSSKNNFNGSYNGQMFSIKNLYINRPDQKCVGLFGMAWDKATIKNIELIDANVTGDRYVGALVGFDRCTKISCIIASVEVKGKHTTGGVIGYSSADSITRCKVTGKVRGDEKTGGFSGSHTAYSIISECSFEGSILGGVSTGGFLGYSNGDVNACFSNASILAGNNTGGFIGMVENQKVHISNCYALGSVNGSKNIGGFIGYILYQGLYMTNTPKIENNYTACQVIGSSAFGAYIGTNSLARITNSYYDTDVVDATMPADGYDHSSSNPVITGLSSSEFADSTKFLGFIFGTNADSPWVSASRPYLYWQDIPFPEAPEELEITEEIDESACGSYFFGGEEYTESGTYTHKFTSISGKDSIVTLHLSVFPLYTSKDSITLAFGETYQFGSQLLNESGTYTEVFSSENGCDSTVTLKFTIEDEITLPIVNPGSALEIEIEEHPKTSYGIAYFPAKDRKGKDITYHCRNDYFELIGNELHVKADAPFDYETKVNHRIDIPAQVENASYTNSIYVKVLDIDEKPSFSDFPETININQDIETDAEIAVISATDPIGRGLQFSIPDNESGAFAIGETSGILTIANKNAIGFGTNSSIQLTIQVSNGIENETASLTVKLNEDSQTGIESERNAINVFPTIVTSELTIVANGATEVNITSVNGKQVYYFKQDKADTLDLSGLSSGTYIVKVVCEHKCYQTCFVKE